MPTITDQIVALLGRYRFRFSNEKQLQDGIAAALTREGIGFAREHPLPPAGVIDFFLPDGRLGLEVKVDGSPTAILRQVRGYAAHPDTAALLVVTSRAFRLTVPGELAGKPFRVHELWSNGL